MRPSPSASVSPFPSLPLFDTLFPEKEQVDNYERESERASDRDRPRGRERERERESSAVAAINVGGFYDTVFPFWSIIEATGERPTDAEPSPPSSFLLLLRSLLLTKTSGEIHLRLVASRRPTSSFSQVHVIPGKVDHRFLVAKTRVSLAKRLLLATRLARSVSLDAGSCLTRARPRRIKMPHL